ncbi:MAG: prolipoprotein diacylglyceryl transferase [Bacillota bacterium]|nr:prolipoprotein diacylglyceryl transferase [Bacillota bacterium]
MHPILIDFGKIHVYSWGFMLAIAIIVAIIGIGKLFAKEGYNQEDILDIVIATVLFGLLGARLAFVLVYQWQDFLANPAMMFSFKNGGFSGLIWYGAFVGGFGAFLVCLWKKKLPFWNVADMFAPFLALGYAIVRVGCFLNGCCYGRVTESAIGVVFPYVDTFARYPTQLFSTGLNLLLFFFLLWYYPRRRFSGQVFIYYLIGYSVYRFIVEYFRETEIMYGILTLGQVYTLGLFGIALLLYFWRKKNLTKR